MTRTWHNAAISLMAIAACAIPARANTILFATGPIQLSGKPVNAEASFEIDHVADTVAISILSLQNNPTSVAQAISGITFTLSAFTNTSPNATIVTERATQVEIDRMGRIVEVEAELDTDWKVIPIATAQFDLCTICNGSGDPDQLLIGGPASIGRYTSANGSIAGNGSHNPFLLASGDSYTEGPLLAANATPRWTVHLNGIQSTTTVNSVTFGFGTSYGSLTAPGESVTATPEPGTIILIGCGIALVGIGKWRKKKGQTA